MSALSLDGVAVELGGRLALHDVTLRVAHGELVGLIGPNGAGKTTLLRAALGLLPLVAGRVEVSGGRPGYVPQRHEFAWDFPIDVRRAVLTGRVARVGLFRAAKAADRAAADAAVDRVGLSALATRPIGELSGGQRQRVLVARALACEPELLLLDEPFTGLDHPTQETLTELFGSLRDEGRALVMTTHDVGAAGTLADRLCLLNRTVVADAPAGELRDPAIWLTAFGVSDAETLMTSLAVR